MPTLHEKCEECKALLGPRNPEIKEAWIHHSFCSKYEAPHIEDQVRAAERLTCREKALMTAEPPPQVAQGEESSKEWREHHESYLKEARRLQELVDEKTAQLYAARGGADHILDDTWKSTSGASSSRQAPPFHLIPFEALCAEAWRFGLGVQKHGRDNLYKALGTPVPEQPYNTSQDWPWMEDRINHGIVHLLRWLAKLQGYIPYDEDDDASAVAWLGTVMYAFQQEWRKRREAADGRG